MIQCSLAVRIVLVALIGAMTYAHVTFEPALLPPPDKRFSEPLDEAPPRPLLTAAHSVFDGCDPFRNIVDVPPPPPPEPPKPEDPPRIEDVMLQFEMVMPLAPNVLLRNKGTGQMLEWRVGKTRTIPWKNRSLNVTLQSVDPNDFCVRFVAPKEQVHVYRLFK